MEDKLKELEKAYQDAQDEYSKLNTQHKLAIGIVKAKMASIQSQLEELRKDEFRKLLKPGSCHSRKNASRNEVAFMKILDNDGKKLLIDEVTKSYDDFGRLSSYFIIRENTNVFFTKHIYEDDHWYEITKEEFEKEII
jgi:ribosome-interacting GTPase 1